MQAPQTAVQPELEPAATSTHFLKNDKKLGGIKLDKLRMVISAAEIDG